MNAILSEKGQVTIPKRLRDDLGLVPGAVLEFNERNGALIVRQVMGTNPIRAWRGKGRLPGGRSVDAYLRHSREGA
jgi:AbrB family looped-hinge helix DNA binding protein